MRLKRKAHPASYSNLDLINNRYITLFFIKVSRTIADLENIDSISPDHIAEALDRGQIHDSGKKFKYSSGNSHFLTALVFNITGEKTGKFANDHLFYLLGIQFRPLDHKINYNSWENTSYHFLRVCVRIRWE
jgi:hypothetical protein